MPSFVRMLSAVLIFTGTMTGAIASVPPVPGSFNPTKTTTLHTRSNGGLNPMGKAPHALEMIETNAKRMARGLPPNKPRFRRHDRIRPRASPAAQANAVCTRNGVIRVSSPANAPSDGNGPRPTLDGYLSSTANDFGEYRYTTQRDNALRVTINTCDGTPFNILASNGLRDFPFVGAVKGYSSDSPNLADGSFNYVYIGGVTQTAPLAPPQDIPNAFTAASEVAEDSESAIWRFQSGSDTVLEAQWVNTDSSTPQDSLVYVPSEDVFILTGDVGRFEETFENVSETTFTFEAV
ncbi:hypothetical protein EIP86_008460 [Pleurotus ostreatoroseus]|nr:hypothetical protein EIP86_008460 [Pleurotus ostreatoroseus]